MKSIRIQLLLGLLLILTGLTVLDSVWSYRDTYHETEEIFDAHLAQYARIVHNLLADALPAVSQPPLVWSAPIEPKGIGHAYERKLSFQVWRETELIARSASAPPDQSYAPLTPGYQDARWEASDWRVFTLPDPDHGLMIQVAERGDVRGEMAELIARRTLSKSLALIPLAALLITGLVGYRLSPLKTLGIDITRRRPNRLEPLATSGLPSELRPIVGAINGLMLRLDQALAQERRFTSDAAHELRTPLGLVRLQIEAFDPHASEAERTAAKNELLRGIDRLSRTVTQMLQLARLEQGQNGLPIGSVDLTALVTSAIAEMAPAALEKKQELGLDAPETPCLLQHAHADALAVMLRNLLDNAIRYTTAEGTINVALSVENGMAQLVIEDNGPGIPETLRQRVWERFFRPPGMQAPGSGLGLSIVRRVLDLHGGTAHLETGTHGRGLRVAIRLPRA